MYSRRKPLMNPFSFLEQYVQSVVSCSSRYNNQLSVSYAPENLVGRPIKYPSYGDYPETYMLRSYGTWWAESEGAQKDYMPHDVGSIVSEDFIVVKFEQPVIPAKVVIYETFNPGAIVRLWARVGNTKWKLLWEGPPQKCDQRARVFSPTIKPTSEAIQLIRIDFNQSMLSCYTSIDAVLLAGHKSRTPLQRNIIGGMLRLGEQSTSNESVASATDDGNKNDSVKPQHHDNDKLSRLPYELLVHILGKLDLKSISSCAQVNRTLRAAASDASLYRNLCLKRYWHLTSNQVLENFIPKCTGLRKLDLSWCGTENSITEKGFIRFMMECGKQITHLSLGNCKFIQHDAMEVISRCSELQELRLRQVLPGHSDCFSKLANLNHLRSLDLFLTNIDDHSLVKILKNNPKLEHLILDLCEHLTELDLVAMTLANCNPKLRSLSCWKTHSLSAEGIKTFGQLSALRELDVGWCLVTSEPGNCLSYIAQGCPELKRLIVSAWHSLTDQQLFPLVRCCKRIEQLDLLGTRTVTGDFCERALSAFHELRLLDLSFCQGVSNTQVARWRRDFPRVNIQRSCESSSTTYS